MNATSRCLAYSLVVLGLFASACGGHPALPRVGDTTTGGLAGPAAAVGPNACGWKTDTGSAASGYLANITGLSALADGEVWAVGEQNSQPFAEHYTGGNWIVANPLQGMVVQSVAAVSSFDVWVAGYGFLGSQQRTAVEHYNDLWHTVKTPNPGTSTDNNSLAGIAQFGTSDVWAVGTHFASATHTDQTLVINWNGTKWIKIPSPTPSGGGALDAVAGTGPSDVWAVGSKGASPLIEHFDGTQWKIVKAATPAGSVQAALYGVTAISPTDVWAAGGYSLGATVAGLLEHWNGTKWSVVAHPNPGSSYTSFQGITALDSAHVWTAGYGHNSGQHDQTIVEFWDGASWTQQVTENPVGSNHDDRLGPAAAISPTNVWAGGSISDVTTLIENYCR